MSFSKNTLKIVFSFIVVICLIMIAFLSSSFFSNDLDNGLYSKMIAGVKSFGFPERLKTDASKCGSNSLNQATFVRALDGDTLEVNGYCNSKIRLLYVDTPETVKPNTAVQCYGPEASNYTKKAFKRGQILYLQTDKEALDKYGRSLIILYENKEDAELKKFENSFNSRLVKQGFAKAKFYSPNTFYKKNLEKTQQEAKNQNLGLWARCSS
jgi:micrococcal nuclease